MTTGDRTRRPGWETMQRNLAADAVISEAVLYASGGRRLTVEHGQPLTEPAGVLVRRWSRPSTRRSPGPATSAAAP